MLAKDLRCFGRVVLREYLPLLDYAGLGLPQNPFLKTSSAPRNLKWVKRGFLSLTQCSQMGPKVGKKWLWTHFTHFCTPRPIVFSLWTHFGSLTKTHSKLVLRGVKLVYVNRDGRKGSLGKRGLFKKVHSLEKNRVCRDSGESPDCRKQRRIRPFPREFRDSRGSSSEKTSFLMTPFFWSWIKGPWAVILEGSRGCKANIEWVSSVEVVGPQWGPEKGATPSFGGGV